MADKEQILTAVKRLAKANRGKAPGIAVFERETGIKRYDWYPDLWLRWGDALAEAGFAPNQLQGKLANETVIEKYIELARELNRFPIYGEIVRKAKMDKSFPTHRVFDRFGGKDQLIEAVAAHCKGKSGFEDILKLCTQHLESKSSSDETQENSKSKISTGFVYLMKSGPHYKIGKTNALQRREGQLAVIIPVPPTTIHSIETDDPAGIEAYWHRRFSDKRGEGEWFKLSSEDVKTFKRWKRIV